MGVDPTRGFVAIPRGLTDWEWYTEPNTARLFIHLLLTSNWQEKQWQGITIHPGELVTSQSQLAKQLNLSIRNIRTALEHLQTTGWVTVKAGPKYSVLTINNYDSFVQADRVSDRLLTGNRQAGDNNLTKITKKTKKQSSSARARETAETMTTTHPVVKEFEASIGRLSASGKAELAAYADRLGESWCLPSLPSVRIWAGAAGRMCARRWWKPRPKGAVLQRNTARQIPSAAAEPRAPGWIERNLPAQIRSARNVSGKAESACGK